MREREIVVGCVSAVCLGVGLMQVWTKVRGWSKYKYVTPKSLKVGAIVYGSLQAPCVYLGIKLKLYKIIKENGWISAAELADKTGYERRFLLEWMSQQTATGILSYNSKSDTYSVDNTWYEILTTEYMEASLLVLPSLFQRLMNVENILTTHSLGATFDDTHINRLTYLSQKPVFEEVICQKLLTHPKALLNDIPLVPQLLTGGLTVLDVGCGSGGCLLNMAQRFPKNVYIGFDISKEAISEAKKHQALSSDAAVHDIIYTTDLAELQIDPVGQCDVVLMYDVLHASAFPVDLLKTVKKNMKKGKQGVFVCVDVDVKTEYKDRVKGTMAGLVYALSMAGCLQSAMSEEGGSGLGSLGLDINTFKSLTTEAGFETVEKVGVKGLNHNAVYFCR